MRGPVLYGMGPLCFTSQVKRGGSLLHPYATDIKLSSAPPSRRTHHAPHPPPQRHAHVSHRRPAAADTAKADEAIHKYLAAETEAPRANVHGRGEDEGRVGGEAAEAQGAVPRHARPLAAAGEDAAQGDRHRHARARRRRHREAALPEQARACTSPATSTGRRTPSDKKLPAILYVCGHSGRGRDGNKTAFQDHGMWFATNGYVCLVVDTLQLGEIAGIHHGTYSLNRWWWHSRGYTPAGVECWNGIRGIDYLVLAARRRPGEDRRHRHLRRRGDDGLDRRGRRARQGRRAGQRHERPGELRHQQGHQRPLRLHVLRQHLPVGVDDDRWPCSPRGRCCSPTATTTRSSRWTATAAIIERLRQVLRACSASRSNVDEYVTQGRPRLPAGPARRDLRVHQQAPEGRHRRR